jgi:hypothetical protein
MFLVIPANAWNAEKGVRRLLLSRLGRRETTLKVDPSSLAYRTGRDEDEMTLTTAFPLSVQKKLDMPKEWELPRQSHSQQATMREKFLWDAELIMGRAAMMAALALMIGEVSTGHSIANQITNFVSRM